MQCCLSSNNWGDGDRVFGKESKKSGERFSFLIILDFSFKFLSINFATGQTTRENGNLRQARAAMNADNCFQRSILQSDTLSSALFCIISAEAGSMKWNSAVSSQLLRT